MSFAILALSHEPLAEATGVASALGALAWPLAGIAIALILRPALADAFERLAPNVKSIGFGEFKVELRELQSISLRNVPVLNDVEDSALTAGEIMTSDASSAIGLAAGGGAIDYVVIDLGAAREGNWLTSRIVLVVALLQRYRNVRYCVFVQNSRIVQRRFVGIVECAALEKTYSEYASAIARGVADAKATRANMAGQSDDYARSVELRAFAAGFLASVQRPVGPGVVDPATQRLAPPPIATGYVRLRKRSPAESFDELASWESGSSLGSRLGDALDQTAVRDTGFATREARVRALVVRAERDYAVVVNSRFQFTAVFDRLTVVNALVRRIAAATPSGDAPSRPDTSSALRL